MRHMFLNRKINLIQYSFVISFRRKLKEFGLVRQYLGGCFWFLLSSSPDIPNLSCGEVESYRLPETKLNQKS